MANSTTIPDLLSERLKKKQHIKYIKEAGWFFEDTGALTSRSIPKTSKGSKRACSNVQ
jgi:hypothetical protein